MKIDLGIQPYNKFWINCAVNSFFSIAITRHASYVDAFYVNDYHYRLLDGTTPENTEAKYLKLEAYSDIFANHINRYASSKPFNFRQDKNFPDLLRDKIAGDQLINVGVDSFYWVDNSLCWQKYHWSHYSLINGFDDDNKTFSVLDENKIGFMLFEIPEARFIKAINSSGLEPHGYIVHTEKEFPPFVLTREYVISNARQICCDIEKLDLGRLWELSAADLAAGHMLDLWSMYVYQIVNRQIANTMLFNKMAKTQMINQAGILEKLTELSLSLQAKWMLVKNAILKALFTKELDIPALRLKVRELFDLECVMWDCLVSSGD